MEEKWRPNSFSPIAGQSAMGEQCATPHMGFPGRWLETGGALLRLGHVNAQNSWDHLVQSPPFTNGEQRHRQVRHPKKHS